MNSIVNLLAVALAVIALSGCEGSPRNERSKDHPSPAKSTSGLFDNMHSSRVIP